MSTRAADDFGEIRRRMIEIAGPAGNPTQPHGVGVCPGCGADASFQDWSHKSGCPSIQWQPKSPEPAWDYCC